MNPERIQRKRTRGWKIPANTVYVGRPTVWGNQFDHQKIGRAEAVRLYREWLEHHLLVNTYMAKHVAELRGRHLACWCPIDQPCHADVLLELANREITA